MRVSYGSEQILESENLSQSRAVKPPGGRICVRLFADELSWLKQMVESSEVGVENPAEMIRLWIHREWRKRRGLSKPSDANYSTAFRNGRPRL
jgi:hypothetical protein